MKRVVVTALANKLARIFSGLITTRQPYYRPELRDATGELRRACTFKHLEAGAKDLGFQLVPTPASAWSFLRGTIR